MLYLICNKTLAGEASKPTAAVLLVDHPTKQGSVLSPILRLSKTVRAALFIACEAFPQAHKGLPASYNVCHHYNHSS
jgi:hypothetical protein